MINFIRSLLGKMGLQLRRSTIIDLREKNIHPFEVAYAIDKPKSVQSVLMNIPISKCRTQLWNTLEKSKNPYVKTLIAHYNNKDLGYESSPIKAYYESYTPKNACEVLKLSNNEVLKQVPAYGYILPWDTQSVDEMIKRRERVAYNENKQEGKQIGISVGHTDFGPVDMEKGELELKRMVKIFENIKNQGYIEKHYLHDGGITGYFLIRENNDWCFIIKSGKHRAYALSALGYENIPIIVDHNMAMIKQVSNLQFWPQVKNGFFSEKEAYTVANNILDVENQI